MNRLIHRLIALAALLGCAAAPVAQAAEDCESQAENVRHGELRWTEGALIVQGTAAPNLALGYLPQIKLTAQRAARVDAYRKAATILSGVHVTSIKAVADTPGAMTRISAIIQGGQVCKTRYYADGGVDVAIRVALNGAIAASDNGEIGTDPARADSRFTGLVVDVRHLDFVPALVPRLIDRQGTVLFDATRVEPKFARGPGVQYANSEPADTTDLLVTRAMSLGTESPSDLVIDDDTAAALASGPGFLGDGRVTLLLRKPHPLDCRSDAARVDDIMVDWQRRLVFARGHGRADFDADQDEAVRMRMMERAGEVDAERLLTTRAAERLGVGTEADARQSPGPLVNAVRCGARFFRDGKSEVVLGVPLDELPVDVNWAEPAGDTRPLNEGASGIIVDATGLAGFMPSLAPQLVSAERQLLYGPKDVSRAYGSVRGGASYHGSVDSARADTRVGDNPLMVKAAGLDATNSRSLIIPNAQAARISSLTSVLRRAAVAIVVDEGKLQQ